EGAPESFGTAPGRRSEGRLMGTINLDDLKPDMMLAAEVKARNGRTLLTAGTTLTAKHIGIFKTWGVTEADIQGVSKEDAAAPVADDIPPSLYRNAEEAVRERFRHTDGAHPFMGELQRICIFRRLKKFGIRAGR
ncbi:MAG: hypothetical protein V3V56_05280, partial [bacterium]